MTTVLDHGLAWLRAPGNALSFAARQLVRWQRGAPALPDQDKSGLFADQPDLAAHAAALAARWQLLPLAACSSRATWRENLALLHVLEQLMADTALPAAEPLRALDVGARNWSYAFGLKRFLELHGTATPRPVALTGIEIDGHGIYPDGRARCDWARAYAAQAEAEWRIGDLLEETAPVDVLTWFFPFVTRYAHLRWGLPLRLFRPAALVAHAWSLLRPGGLLLAFHQTRREQERFVARVPQGGRVRTAALPQSPLVLDPEAAADRCATICQR